MNCPCCIKNRLQGQGQKLGDQLGDCCKDAGALLVHGDGVRGSDPGRDKGFPDGVNVDSEKGWTQGLFLFKTS